MGKITALTVLNGAYGDFDFVVGATSRFGKVRKIENNPKKENAYIVFLEDFREIDIMTDKILVVTQY